MNEKWDYHGCQSLFGYARKVHERSGGVCQLCGCGNGSEVDFHLWRQLTVEHLVGASQGGYLKDIKRALAKRFPHLPENEVDVLAQEIDEANTVTACSFCNSTTSRHRAEKTMRQLIDEAPRDPCEAVKYVATQLRKVLAYKRSLTESKIERLREGFESEIRDELTTARAQQLTKP